MKKITILQVVPSLYSGGVERGTVEISEAIVKAGMNSIVVSSGGTMASKITDHGGMHITLNVASKNPFVIRSNIKKILAIIENYNVSLVHARSRAPAWSCYKACKIKNIPFVTTFHGTYGHNFIKKHYNKVMTYGDRVIAVSNYIKEYISKHFPKALERTLVIHRGVDTHHFDPYAVPEQRIVNAKVNLNINDIGDKSVILLPARVTRWKGHLLFIEALKQLDKSKYRAVILGDSKGHSNYLSELKDVVEKAGLEGNVTFVEHLFDMSAIYMVSDIVVIPSLKPEAFGRVAIEAQSMAKIVLASNIGGAIETIIDEETGFLFESGSSDDLALRLHEIMTMDSKHRQRLGIKAREHIIENFTLAKMQADTIKVYKELLNIV
ncbi:MAG: glycosyltransferase family 4 protein [Alphaproteobacteria bacterium]|nr:glycosyltransferase family 4 protein [Alphaproteobacteria bacterium]OJV13670.1 MAG: hypothetical protein BGO27_00665 [Alphaproteobacteria bacterium 33-17]